MQCRILGDQSAANFARSKRVHLGVKRADLGALCIIQNWQIDRTGDVILGPFRRRTHVDNLVKTERVNLQKRGEGDGHSPF